MNVINEIREHRGAARLFKAHLMKGLSLYSVKMLLDSNNKSLYGEIIEFLHSYGASIVLTNNSVYITVSKEHSVRFSSIEHGNMKFIYYKKLKGDTTFEHKFNHAIVMFFKLLDESIL